MKISQILNEKDISVLHVISKDALVSDAANKLSELRIGSLLVSEDGQSIDGILSERDIVRQLGKTGAACLELKVSDLMTENVKTVTSHAEARQAMKIMSEGRFRHLPVVDDGNPVGMISIGDVVSARIKEIENENNALNDMISGTAF